MTQNKLQHLHGFTIEEIRPLPEIRATMYRMRYAKNGADLVWLDREDDNKTFAITFKTLPQDDTGVFHILEHSVLNGSEKYPLREPFVELIKSSLQTFLNAFTYPDKTMYPVCSRNDQDFLNLIDVYMDAVLHPLSVTDPHAFRQEGWHYELDDPDGELVCNGVVYNEMKGAYADPDSVLVGEMNRLLFPDVCYGFESGGHPDHIPELTFDNYRASHARFYHPSNARIFLDGSVDMDAVLAKLDGFLAPYDRLAVDAEIPMQAPVAPAETAVPYEIGPEDDGENKVILAGGWVFGDFREPEKALAGAALARLLCGSNEAPLKKALLEKGLAEDVDLVCQDGIQQLYFLLVVRNTSLAKKEEVWKTAEEVLRRQAAEGLDRGRLHAILNRLEFTTRERDYGGFPLGLAYAITAQESWLYGGDPAQNLCRDEAFHTLRRRIDEGWFEGFLTASLLDNPHRARLCLTPSKTLGEEKRQAERARLAGLKAGWSQAEIQEVIRQFHALRDRQGRPDTPEQLATLPVLSLADIPEEAPALRQTLEDVDGTPLLYHDIETSGITYLTLFFDVHDLSLAELRQLPMLCTLLGEMATERYSALELHSRIEGSLGRFTAAPAVYALVGQTEDSLPVVAVSLALLEGGKADAVELLREVLRTSRFDDTQAVYQLLCQSKLVMEQTVVGAGNAIAVAQAAASFSAKGTAEEAMAGMGQLRWLQRAERAFSRDGEALCGAFADLCNRIFIRDRVTLSLTGARDEDWLRAVLAALPVCPEAVGAPAVYPRAARSAVGVQIPAEIGFAARCGSLDRVGAAPTGAALVAANLLTYDYLWNQVRVKGGAYGTGLRVAADGRTAFYSYRDPGCDRSLDTFLGAGEALRQFCGSGEKPDRYIISTIGSMEPVMTPRMEGSAAAALYFNGQTQADRQRTRSQVLHTTLEDLRAFSEILDKLCEDSAVCVVGGEAALDQCGEKLERRELLQEAD